MNVRRLLVAVVAGLLAIPASAAADDAVTEMLEETSAAEYHGLGVVMCTWGRDSSAATYTLTHTDGMSMVDGPDGAMMASGGTAAIRSDADWYGTRVEEWAAWSVSDRYSLGETIDTVRLGRPAMQVTVLEAGEPRVRMVVDSESMVPLSTEVLDGEGRVFRMAALIDFAPGSPEAPEMPDVEVMGTARPMAAPGSLPEIAAGYLRADVYDAGPETVHAFYSDGLFSFSVFESPRGGRPPAFEGAAEFDVAGRTYRRIVTPTSVWIQWDAPDRSYVLVGDLPPDHAASVLEELPVPGQRGWLVRLWRRLFG